MNYLALYDSVMSLNSKSKEAVLFYSDGIWLVTYNGVHYEEGWWDYERCIFLYPKVLKNFEEQMNEIKEKLEQMKNGELEKEYESYLGDRIFIFLDPRYNNVLFTKYAKEEEDGDIYELLEEHFVFTLYEFMNFLKAWNESTNHIALHEVITNCSPKHPCMKEIF